MPSSHCRPEFLDDVGKCVAFLKDMEVRWSGAKRSRIIIEQLLQHKRSKLAVQRDTNQSQPDVSPAEPKRNNNKRKLDDFQTGNAFLWGEVPGSELFSFDPLDPVLFSPWE